MTFRVKCEGYHPDWVMKAWLDYCDEQRAAGVTNIISRESVEKFENKYRMKLNYDENDTGPDSIDFETEGDAVLMMLRWT